MVPCPWLFSDFFPHKILYNFIFIESHLLWTINDVCQSEFLLYFHDVVALGTGYDGVWEYEECISGAVDAC
tara:strand:+ start:572 stop:784 length:213 start_codon:yes stop_codon:yes gene_type:complete